MISSYNTYNNLSGSLREKCGYEGCSELSGESLKSTLEHLARQESGVASDKGAKIPTRAGVGFYLNPETFIGILLN